ncbi:hypothetical protein [Butyrivibrio sp. NC3005]|uniref:hypothetical protein n=1 Tax=Butyrivibrio sp. NC3005 TaxID=1280685 RepID=UPI0006876B7E|nr:hypothetical protein [Butyrivibrio sp. NC3005]
MKVEFFQGTDGKLDSNSIKAGVYRISIYSDVDREKVIPLYIGESYCMIKRGGEHLYNVQKSPSYLGLTEETYADDSLVLSFEVYEVIEECWSNTKERDLVLEKHELDALAKVHPVSQYETNDHVMRNAVEIVSTAIKEKLK